MNFNDAVIVLLGHEGGYSDRDRKSDPGGKTMYGVTESVARRHGYKGDMRKLPRDLAINIYKVDFWDKAKCDDVPFRLRYALFDGAVHSGPVQSVKWLQRALMVADDGILGPKTMAAAYTCNRDEVLLKMLGLRLEFLSDRLNWDANSEGWAKRIASIMAM